MTRQVIRLEHTEIMIHFFSSFNTYSIYSNYNYNSTYMLDTVVGTIVPTVN